MSSSERAKRSLEMVSGMTLKYGMPASEARRLGMMNVQDRFIFDIISETFGRK